MLSGYPSAMSEAEPKESDRRCSGLVRACRGMALVVPNAAWADRGTAPRTVIRSASLSGEWRNGRRAGFRCQCPSGRGGSSPPSPTDAVKRGRVIRTRIPAPFYYLPQRFLLRPLHRPVLHPQLVAHGQRHPVHPGQVARHLPRHPAEPVAARRRSAARPAVAVEPVPQMDTRSVGRAGEPLVPAATRDVAETNDARTGIIVHRMN